MVPVHANRQPALAAYARADNGRYALHSLQVLTVTESGISRNTSFQDQDVFSYFGLPAEITRAKQ
jgi:RNA polymerase sigma-70 factor (ECF subfamily)